MWAPSPIFSSQQHIVVMEQTPTVTSPPTTTATRYVPMVSLTTIFTLTCGIDILYSYDDWPPKIPISCQPPNWMNYLKLFPTGDGYYSPAICPSGFYPACSRFYESQGPPVAPRETACNCAPLFVTYLPTCLPVYKNMTIWVPAGSILPSITNLLTLKRETTVTTFATLLRLIGGSGRRRGRKEQ